MQIDLKALEQALAPIAEIGKGEIVFAVGDTQITMRVLLPNEERAIQRFAGEVLANTDETDITRTTEYLDRFRISTLSHVVVGVDGVRFPDFVATGEVLDNGVSVQIERHKAIRPMIEGWSRTVMTGCFKKWGELLARVEKNAEKAIVFAPSDADSEIERLEDRLKAVKKEKETANQGLRETFSRQVSTIATPEEQELAAFAEEQTAQEQTAQEQTASRPAPAPQRTAPPEPKAPPAPRRQPIVPQSATPPAVTPKPQQAAKAPKQTDPYDTSFVNANDDEEMQRAVEAENARLMKARQRQSTGHVLDEGSVLARRGGLRPPHLAARDAEVDVGVLEHARQTAERVGVVDGVETYAMPPQTLSASSVQQGAGAPVPVNAHASATGTTNPRFRPPTGQP